MIDAVWGNLLYPSQNSKLVTRSPLQHEMNKRFLQKVGTHGLICRESDGFSNGGIQFVAFPTFGRNAR